jgi:hypothetical protein
MLEKVIVQPGVTQVAGDFRKIQPYGRKGKYIHPDGKEEDPPSGTLFVLYPYLTFTH